MITQWKDLDPARSAVLKLNDGQRTKGVFVRAAMIRAFKGDGSAAIYASQLIYWSRMDKSKANDGWFYLTTNRVTKDLGISKDIQSRVRTLLLKRGLLEQRTGDGNKNYYRIHLDVLADILASEYTEEADDRESESLDRVGDDATHEMEEMGVKPPTSRGESLPRVGGKASHIVKTTVNQESKHTPASSPARRSATKTNVLGDDRFAEAQAYIMANYPPDSRGLRVDKDEARGILNRLGSVKATSTKEERDAATERLTEFKTALKNIKRAVATGEQDPRYVESFATFAGLGVSYGKLPTYKKWATRVFVTKKQELVV